MPLTIPRQPRRLYARNPLKLVIAQIRFPVLLRFDEPSFIAPFQEALRGRYPRSALEQQVDLLVGSQGPITGPAKALWRLRSAEGAWTVSLAPDALSLETTAYERWEGFAERIEEVFDSGVQSFGLEFRERLGLRYVDEIHHPEGDSPALWRRLLNPDLLGLVGGELLGEDIIHALEEIRLQESDGVVVIRHGFVRPGASDGESHYLLDCDCFDESPRPLALSQTLEQLEAYRWRCHDVFETSITDELREVLGVVEVIG